MYANLEEASEGESEWSLAFFDQRPLPHTDLMHRARSDLEPPDPTVSTDFFVTEIAGTSATSDGQQLVVAPERRMYGPSAETLVKNGERVINATWQCTFPTAGCFKKHGAHEHRADNLKLCHKQKNLGRTIIELSYNLRCAKEENFIHCSDKRNSKESKFDPYKDCNNDPNLVKAGCQLECRKGVPFQVCIYTLDQLGIFNLTDQTVKACRLEATCMSPYVEQNQMFCSSVKATKSFSPDWVKRNALNPHKALNMRKAEETEHRLFASRPETMPLSAWVLWVCAFSSVVFTCFMGCNRIGFCAALKTYHHKPQYPTIGAM